MADNMTKHTQILKAPHRNLDDIEWALDEINSVKNRLQKQEPQLAKVLMKPWHDVAWEVLPHLTPCQANTFVISLFDKTEIASAVFADPNSLLGKLFAITVKEPRTLTKTLLSEPFDDKTLLALMENGVDVKSVFQKNKKVLTHRLLTKESPLALEWHKNLFPRRNPVLTHWLLHHHKSRFGADFLLPQEPLSQQGAKLILEFVENVRSGKITDAVKTTLLQKSIDSRVFFALMFLHPEQNLLENRPHHKWCRLNPLRTHEISAHNKMLIKRLNVNTVLLANPTHLRTADDFVKLAQQHKPCNNLDTKDKA